MSKKIKSPIEINKIHHLNHNQLSHPSKAILDDIKGSGGLHSDHVTSSVISSKVSGTHVWITRGWVSH